MKRNLPGMVAVGLFAMLAISLYVASAFLPGPSPMASPMHQGSGSGYALGAANLLLILSALMAVLTAGAWERKPRRHGYRILERILWEANRNDRTNRDS